MDPWWYGGSCGARGPPPPQCHNAAAWPWAANWSAAPGFFPQGLSSLGLPLTLYSNSYAQVPVNEMQQFSWVNCSSCFSGTPGYAHVVSEQSYDFHSYLFDVGAPQGMNAFEIDFVDFVFEGFDDGDFGSDVRAYDAYMAGMDRAAAEHGFPVQLCMGLPAITLASVAWPTVTNARLQGDGYATATERYDIFQTSLLYSAVALAPFLDNIWTTSCQPGWDNAFGNATCEDDVEGLAAIATLSVGPVGIGDAVGFTNVTLVNMTCRSDGILLQPSLPAVNLELYFADLLPHGGARITVAPSFIPSVESVGAAGSVEPYPFPPPDGSALYATVFATFVATPVAVSLADMWPPLPLPGASNVTGYFVTMLSRASLCVDGAPAEASGCAAAFTGNASAALLVADTGARAHEVYSIAPTPPGGWTLLGELAKFTRVSPSRVAAVDAGCAAGAPPSVCVAIAGAPGEVVTLTLVDPRGTVRVARLVVDAAGGARAVCGCSAVCECMQQ